MSSLELSLPYRRTAQATDSDRGIVWTKSMRDKTQEHVEYTVPVHRMAL